MTRRTLVDRDNAMAPTLYRVVDGPLAGRTVSHDETTECDCGGLDRHHGRCLGTGRVLGWLDRGTRPTGRLEPVTR